MLVTPSGMVMLESEVQSLNAELPILVTLSGIVMLISELQYANAELLMHAPPVIVTVVSDFGTVSKM